MLAYQDYDAAQPHQPRSAEEKSAILDLCLNLVDVSLDDEARRDVRRRRSKDELSQGVPEREDLIDVLTQARLLSVDTKDDEPARVDVDLIHETLLANWDHLRQAIAQRRHELRQRARFEQQLKEWVGQNRSDDYLLNGVRLAEARDLERQDDVALRNPAAKDFVQRSIEREEARHQKELDDARQLAEETEARRKAETERRQDAELAALRLKKRNRLVTGISIVALLLAILAGVAAVIASKNAQRADAQSVIASQNAARAEEQARLADDQRTKAEAASKLAADNEQTAHHERDNAIAQQKIAHAQRLVAQAQIALKQGSLQQLAMLLALTAQKNSPSAESETILRTGMPRLPFPVGQLSNLGYVNATAFSPDGRQFVTADDSGLQIWDANTGEKMSAPIEKAGVQAVVFSSDGAWLFSGEENQARMWDAAGKTVAMLKQPAWVVSLAVSPDGQWLATAGEDGSVSVWQTAALRAGDTIESITFRHEGRVNQLVFSPDNKLLATASADGTTRVWDVAANQEVSRVAHGGSVLSVAFSPDSQRLATGGGDATARVWDVATRGVLREMLRLVHGDWVEGVAFSPDGKILATASDDGTARVWNVTTGQEVWRLPHQKAVRQVIFSPNGKWIVTGSTDLTARLWDAANGQEVSQMSHLDALTAIAYSPIGSRLVTADASGLTQVWNMAAIDQMEMARIEQKDWVRDIAFNADGSQVATASDDNFTAWLWNITGNKPQVIREFQQDNQDFVRAVALSPDGRWLAAAGDDRTAWVWDLSNETDTTPRRFTHEGEVNTLAFSPDGQQLASGGADQAAHIWNLITGEESQRLPLEGAVTAVAFSPNGKQLATADEAGTFKVWDAANGKELLSHLTDYLVRDIAVHPDGHTLVIAADRFVYIWDIANNKEVRNLVHDGEVRSVAISPDGKLIVSTSDDGTTRLWDAVSGAELARIFHIGTSLAVAFSPSGDRLAVADGNLVHVRDVNQLQLVRTDQLADEVCARLTHNLTQDAWRVYFGDESYRKICPNLP